jgi:hypothetical protein
MNKTLAEIELFGKRMEEIETRMGRIEANQGHLRQTLFYDWDKHGNYSMKLFETPRTWLEANNNCVAFGARLVHIDNAEDNKAVAALQARRGGGEAWIGREVRAQLNNGFEAFGETLPVLGCVSVIKGMWMSRDCHSRLAFVCQM